MEYVEAFRLYVYEQVKITWEIRLKLNVHKQLLGTVKEAVLGNLLSLEHNLQLLIRCCDD